MDFFDTGVGFNSRNNFANLGSFAKVSVLLLFIIPWLICIQVRSCFLDVQTIWKIILLFYFDWFQAKIKIYVLTKSSSCITPSYVTGIRCCMCTYIFDKLLYALYATNICAVYVHIWSYYTVYLIYLAICWYQNSSYIRSSSLTQIR